MRDPVVIPYVLDPACPHTTLTDKLNVTQEEVRRAFMEEGHLYRRLWTCDACGGLADSWRFGDYDVDGKRATKRERPTWPTRRRAKR